MKRSKLPFYLLITGLITIGLVLSIFRHLEYQVPWMPGEKSTIWSIEARVEFDAIGEAVKVNLSRPQSQNGFTLINESTASPGYGVAFIDQPPKSEWSIRQAINEQTLFYRADFLVDNSQATANIPAPKLNLINWEEPFKTAANQILSQVRQQSADEFSFAQQLFKILTQQEQDQNIALLENKQSNLARLAVDLLNQAAIPAQLIYGLKLEDGRRRQDLVPFVRVWQNEETEIFQPMTGLRGLPEEYILWQQLQSPVLEVVGANHSGVSFSIIKKQESIAAAVQAKQDTEQNLVSFSIHSLPIEEQALFKTILLLPVGALVVCLLRILVGLRTSGTFMPVLIAVAFIQTSLITGLVGFLLVVLTGLMLRSYLSHLNLLLVARISAVIISVIAIIAVFSVLSYKVGLTEGLKVTFFPMIILSWTVERMSILWEEEGAKEVLIQGGGSLLTALIAYLAMTSDVLRHLTFNFLGMQFIILAAILLLGNYTGYRLLELYRFKPMLSHQADQDSNK
ncbi:inactive transglutaminase family protein [Catenovulum adriaticum]|uniref:Inactive transglutaminase family protein n=1 Tax=Catenovulum adriaticum TaxID=2984846 RepID=A0ABY7AJF0_9ALTE|nr:inactive transglutaminase family protein [Catenovulum sp. TS8]WAJ69579.1 inactive transglutaminase family protein [Catenovulum sp. TS8]